MDFESSTLDDGVTVIRADGRLNMASAAGLRATVSESIEQGHPRVVVDLSATTFVDSSGLGALIGGLKSARQAGGNLRITAPTEQVLTVLRLTNLDQVLRPFATIEDAIREW